MKSDRILVQHLRESAAKVGRFIAGMDYDDFVADEKTISAVVRELTVIGEAAANLSSEFTERHSHIPFHEVIGMRNRIVHEYWAVDDETVWKTCTQDIPDFAKLLEQTS